MEEEDEESFFNGGGFHASPFISRASFITPSPCRQRRLSSTFSEPNRPIPSARRLSWVDLQGKLVNAEEASSSKAIGGCLSREDGLAWDLFSPIHRILIVAVVAVATADLKKSRQIWQIQRSRNEELLSMQRECGCRLCDHHQRNSSVENISSEDEMFKFKPLMIKAEQEERRMSDISDLASSVASAADIQLNSLAIEQDNYNLRMEREELYATIKELSASVKATEVGSKRDHSVEIGSSEDVMFKFKPPMIGAEQEERRMSDFSDFAYSVTSATDTQLNELDIEQDLNNFMRETEEKDAIIEEKVAIIDNLLAVVKATDAAGSQRITELEELVRRKNMRITELEELVRRKNMSITKLKKDRAILEQKVVNLTRLRRPSTSSTLTIKPTMSDNLLYYMSSTSPSSSDSDSPSENRTRVSVNQEHQETPTTQDVATRNILQTPSAKPPMSLPKSTNRPSSSDSDSPSENRTRVSVNQEHQQTPTPQDVATRTILQTPSPKPPMSLPKSTNRPPRSQPVSPLTENSMNQRLDSPNGVPIRNRRRIHSVSKDSAQSKRWV